MNLIMELDELRREYPEQRFNLIVPENTRAKLCKHNEIVERNWSQNCVVDYFCANCHEWLGDKDYS